METLKNSSLLKTALKFFAMLAIVFVSQQTLAATSELTISCPNDDPAECQVSGNSAVAVDIIEFAANLINSGTDERCTSTEGGLICNLAPEGSEYPINLRCTEGSNSMYCQLDSATETPAYSIDCNRNEGESGQEVMVMAAGGGSCTIRTNTDAFAELLPPDLNDNLLNIASNFLNCVNGNSFGGAAELCGQLINALDNNPELASALIKALAPLNPEDSSNLSTTNMRGAASAIQQRLSRLRSGDTLSGNIETRQYFADNQWLENGSLLAAAGNTASDVTPGNINVDKNISEFGKLGFFINLSAINSKYNIGSIAAKSDSSSSILTLGVDYRVTDNLVTGLAFNIGQSKVEYKDTTSGELKSDSYSFIVYNSFYKNNWYLDTALTFGGDSYDQVRDPSAVDNTFEADYYGSQYSLAVTTGYEFIINAFSIAPFIQLTVGKLDIDSYNESSTACLPPATCGVALSLDEQSKDIGSLNAGSHFRYVVNTEKGVFIPVLTLSAVSDFEDDAQTVTGRFIGVTSPNSGFSIQTSKMDSSYFVVGAGFSFQLKNGNAGFLNLETLQGYENLDQQRITLGWRWEI